VAERRFEHVLRTIAVQPAGSLIDRLCAASAQHLESSGVGIALIGSGDLLETVAATTNGHAGERLHSDLGEGPAYDAHRNGWPVLAEDLATDLSWPAFCRAADDIGLRAVFAFPLRRGSVRLGALTLYRTAAGELTDEHHADALVYARLALDLCLGLQADSAPGELDRLLLDATRTSATIHQATGVVAVQLGVTVGAALAVLRAHAYAEQRTLQDVAGDVVARRLRLDHHPDAVA
jgi:hypothetical protein